MTMAYNYGMPQFLCLMIMVHDNGPGHKPFVSAGCDPDGYLGRTVIGYGLTTSSGWNGASSTSSCSLTRHSSEVVSKT